MLQMWEITDLNSALCDHLIILRNLRNLRIHQTRPAA